MNFLKSVLTVPLMAASIFCLLADFSNADTIWEPQDTNTQMTKHVYNTDQSHRRITWRPHGGFRISVDGERTYDNWRTRDDAPRVRLALDDDLLHLRGRDFVIQAKITIPENHGEAFQAGIYVGFGPHDLVVFGPHGSTRLRLRGPNVPSFWVDFNARSCFLKLKRRGNEYTAWHSYDGQIWRRDGVVWAEHGPTDVGAILKTWGEPRAERADFAHLEITHVENEPNSYQAGVRYYGVANNSIKFIYDLSGIEIPVHVYIRDADGNATNDYDRKLYLIHGSFSASDWPLPAYRFADFIPEMTDPANATDPIGSTDVVLVTPQFNYRNRHPYFGYRMQYRSFDGEEDWILIDLHENFIRERFPASTFTDDHQFFLAGQSAGGRFVSRFIMAHPNKLEAAVARAPGQVTFPYRHTHRFADLVWPRASSLRGDIRQRNPRLNINLNEIRDLRFAAMCGENDNNLYLPMEQPSHFSHVDGSRKWIRQLEQVTRGLTHGQLLLVPGEGHGYGKVSRELTFDFLFGPGGSANLTNWRYGFTLMDQDEGIRLEGTQVPDDVFRYSRFQKWTWPGGEPIASYEFDPSGMCQVLTNDGEPSNRLDWDILRASNGDLGLKIGSDFFHAPNLNYGRLFLIGTDYHYRLSQTAFVTERFIHDWIVGTTFNLFWGTGRNANGPTATASIHGPFRLHASGRVISASPSSIAGTPYSEPDMQRWQFDPVTSTLNFTDDAGSSSGLTIGEWRWGHRQDGTRFIAGLDTRNRGRRHAEIQTDAVFQPRYFEDWDTGPHTWLTTENTPQPTSVNITDMVAYFPFEDNANDLSGNGHNATEFTGSFGPGRIGRGLVLDGIDDIVRTALEINQGSSPEMTVSVWANPKAVDGRRQVFSSDDGGFDRSLLIQDGEWHVFNGTDHLRFNLPANTDLWQHITVIFSPNLTTLYVNARYKAARPGGTGASFNPFCIGNNPGQWNEPFEGTIDEVRVYDRALNIDEIWELYSMR